MKDYIADSYRWNKRSHSNISYPPSRRRSYCIFVETINTSPSEPAGLYRYSRARPLIGIEGNPAKSDTRERWLKHTDSSSLLATSTCQLSHVFFICLFLTKYFPFQNHQTLDIPFLSGSLTRHGIKFLFHSCRVWYRTDLKSNFFPRTAQRS